MHIKTLIFLCIACSGSFVSVSQVIHQPIIIFSADDNSTINVEESKNYKQVSTSEVFLKGVYFDSSISFAGSEISDLVRLKQVEFNQDVDFEKVKFPNKITFNNVEFNSTVASF